MLLIYAPTDTPRLRYTLQLIFHELLQMKWALTTDPAGFAAYSGARLNYSKTRMEHIPFLYADDLLFSQGIAATDVTCGDYNGIRIIFSHDASSDLPFDPLAASFYLVSRFEEYLPFRADRHGRFPAEESLNYRAGFHRQAVVNHYALLIRNLLQSHDPGLHIPENKFTFELTYDIDMAYAYREKGWLRNAGGYLKALGKLNLKEMMQRSRVLAGMEKDPFDTFDFQQELHERYHLHPAYFFLLGDHGAFDKNISWRNTSFMQLVRRISEVSETGIHASYASNDSPQRLSAEKARLEQMSGKKVIRNRQHFLKLKMPATYQHLLSAGITDDYTMGYASQIGFRAGIATPFYFYDLSREETTTLRIHPFAAMDAAMFYYLKMDAGTALQQMKLLTDELRAVGGTFCFLAHNDLISSQGPWQGWPMHFEQMIDYATQQ